LIGLEAKKLSPEKGIEQSLELTEVVMEPSTGFRASAWSCFKFLPFFCGLLLLGIIKGEYGLELPWMMFFMQNGRDTCLKLFAFHSIK
jgi:hypothetical protein